MRPQNRTVDEVIGQLAFSAYGLVTRSQLLSTGITRGEIRARLERGTLLREHRGVYRVGHRAPSVEARYLGAVFACGDDARLCGRAGGHLFGLLQGAPPPPEVMAPTERRASGVITHRRAVLLPDECTVWRRIPVTTVPRTLLDLAPVLSSDALALACHEAGIRYDTTPAHVDALIARHPRAPGVPKLRAALHGDVHVSLSALERRFLKRLRAAGFPLPKTNIRASERRVDCRWGDHRLTVELDGYKYHRSRHAWENDRRREREAYARGDQFRRYTWGDVFEDPSLMMAELRGLLLPA